MDHFFLKRFKKIVLLLCLFTISLSSAVVNAQESQLSEAAIFIDNKPVTTKYIMRDGHLLVPALFLKQTGAYVDWDTQYRSVVFQAGQTRFALPVGQNYSDVFIKGSWVRHPLPTETLEFRGERFVPLVPVARKLGMDVHYDPSESRTYITTNLAPRGTVMNHGDPTQKIVALTFDDGPDSRYTPQILDILKEKGVKATFFVVGNQLEEFSEEMKRMVDEGHGIANHTWSHPDLRKLWSSDVRKEILSTQAEIARVVGRKPDLFRPPYGAYLKSDLAVLNEIGMRTVLWNVDTLDWSGLSGDEILAIVKRDISPGGIILQHNFPIDADLLAGTVEALPRIIDELRAEGYRFVTVQTLLAGG